MRRVSSEGEKGIAVIMVDGRRLTVHCCLCQAELIDIKNLTRSTTYHGPFSMPSTPLFEDFCAAIMKTYRLEEVVRQAEVNTGMHSSTRTHSSTQSAMLVFHTSVVRCVWE